MRILNKMDMHIAGDTNVINYHRIEKVYEYENRYEIYDQIIFVEKKFGERSTEIKGYAIYSDYQKSNTIAVLDSEEYNQLIGEKKDGKKLIEAYQNLLPMYCHTFIKNEDGTCYWYQSEFQK